MSSATLPRSPRRSAAAGALADALVVAFATAGDVAAGMERVTALLAAEDGIARVEWWAPVDGAAALRLAAASGAPRGERRGVPFGPAGALVVDGDEPLDAVAGLVPVVRQRWADEQLAGHAVLLARRSQALEDFAALVSHELKGPLHAALLTDDPAPEIRRALHVVDSVLEAVRSESASNAHSSPQACLDDALRDLGRLDAEVFSTLPDEFPLPAAVLRIVLRNLLANAVAAGASRIEVSGTGSTLDVADDGAGDSSYAHGDRIGLALCRRLVERLGSDLMLCPRSAGGTSARIVL